MSNWDDIKDLTELRDEIFKKVMNTAVDKGVSGLLMGKQDMPKVGSNMVITVHLDIPVSEPLVRAIDAYFHTDEYIAMVNKHVDDVMRQKAEQEEKYGPKARAKKGV